MNCIIRLKGCEMNISEDGVVKIERNGTTMFLNYEIFMDIQKDIKIDCIKILNNFEI